MTARVRLTDEERAHRVAAFEALGFGPQEAALKTGWGELPIVVVAVPATPEASEASDDTDVPTVDTQTETADPTLTLTEETAADDAERMATTAETEKEN